MNNQNMNRLGPARGFLIGSALAGAFWLCFIFAVAYMMSGN